MNPSDEPTGRPHSPISPHPVLDESDDTFRPVPRNRKRKKRRLRSTLIYQLRLIGMAVGGMLAAYVAFLLIQKIVHPYKLGHEVGAQIAELRTKLDREEQANTLLRERILFLRTKEGAEAEARHAGYHRKGETVYLLPVTPDTPAPAAPR